MVQRQVFLKGEGLALFLFNFLKFIILHLEITLTFAKLCYAFEEKYFFCRHNIMKKVHYKLSKNEPENIP